MNPGNTSYLRHCDGIADLKVATASYGPGGAGAQIAYTVVPSRFGLVLIAATDRGICWIGIHESTSHLESELRRDLRKAEIIRGPDAMGTVAAEIIRFVELTRASIQLSLDIRATPFQLEVWRELCAIPAGATRSYGEIARKLGKPAGARAVGHANGSNPLALVIPCHRVIGANGELTGYRWGLEYKRRLLEHERARKEASREK
jgi:AraC family transcriptional regulator of adaptative response/methylated-DNA-[protein]-cysteine methyltransferase